MKTIFLTIFIMAGSLVAQGNSNPWGSNHPEETHTNTNGNGHNGGHNGWGHGHHGGNSGGNGGGKGEPCGPGGEPVPEPGTMLLAGSGLAAVFAARRKRKNAVEEIVSE